MTLEQATSSHNDFIILDADEPYYRSVFEDVIEVLLQVGVRIEATVPGTAYVRFDGMESLRTSEWEALRVVRGGADC